MHRIRSLWVVATLFVALAVLRIISTYQLFNQTLDEPIAVSSGLEWLERGTHLYGPEHPPLAHIVAALGVYFSGVRLTDSHKDILDRHQKGTFDGYWLAQELIAGTDLLQQGRGYFHNLSLARAGILFFFVLSLAITWAWSRSLFGEDVALLAVLLLSTLPPFLGNAGLATTDMALACFVPAGLFSFAMWLENPKPLWGILVGITWGLAALSKFSALLFLPACAVALLMCRHLLRKREHTSDVTRTRTRCLRARIGTMGVAALIAFLVVWAGYRFSLSHLTTAELRPHNRIDTLVGREGVIHDLAYVLAETPIPLKEYFDGVWIQKEHNELGHKAYLLGHYSQYGWWYFFPVVFAIKTPIAYLILVLVGCVALVLLAARSADWRPIAPLVCAATIMVAMMPSNVALGSRYILPVYPLLTPVAAFGASYLWRRKRALLARGATLILIGWHLTSTTLAHPNYISYFNEVADSSPERFVADSDIDWGQDLYRLSLELKRRNIQELGLAYHGDPRLIQLFDLPKTRFLNPSERRHGWIAISVYELKGVDLPPPHDGYAWLEDYKSVASDIKSIKLYYVPENDRQSVSTRR